MLFMIILFVMYAVTWLIPPPSRWTLQGRWRVALALGLGFAGISHLVSPTPFLQHLPEWMPLRSAVVFGSGLVEIAFAVALLVRTSWRPRIGLALAAYLVAVFPGNIYVAVAGVEVDGQPGGIYPWLRLPLQALFIWLALWATKGSALRRPPTAQPPAMTADPGALAASQGS